MSMTATSTNRHHLPVTRFCGCLRAATNQVTVTSPGLSADIATFWCDRHLPDLDASRDMLGPTATLTLRAL